AEFVFFEEAPQLIRIGIRLLPGVQTIWQRHLAVEFHKPAGEPRLICELDEALASLWLLDLLGPSQERLQIAVGADQLGSGLDTDAGDARYIIDRVPG